MDAGLLLKLCTHLVQSHLNFRLRIEQSNARTRKGCVVLEGIHGCIDGHLFLHLIGIVRIAGKPEPAAGQHGHRHHQNKYRRNTPCHDFLSHHSFLLFYFVEPVK